MQQAHTAAWQPACPPLAPRPAQQPRAADPPAGAQQQAGRRALLAGLAATVATSGPAPSAAAFSWDGKSSALGSCALGEEGAECRSRGLQREKELGRIENYDAITKGRPQENSVGLAVAKMTGDAYSKETVALGDVIVEYANLDVYSPRRAAVVQELRKDAASWVSKYARGGSARKVSARRFYIAVDALQGHLASNGLAPFPKQKLSVLLANVEQAKALIAQNK